MNIQPTEYKKKKYTVKATKKEDYSEANPRSREEFAKGFIQAYDGALKKATGKANKKNDFDKKLERWLKIAEEMANNEN